MNLHLTVIIKFKIMERKRESLCEKARNKVQEGC